MDNPNTPPLERRLQLALPLADVRTLTEQRLKKLARTVRMQGFRPGKVPYRLVVQQYGAQVQDEVLNEMAQGHFGATVRSQELRVAGPARFEATATEQADTFEFAAIFEVYPEVVLGEWTGYTIEKPVVTVSEEDIERTLDVLRRQRVQYEAVERAAQNEDRVRVDFTGTLEGVEFAGGKGQDVSLVLGSGRFLADFERALLGMRAGEEKTFPLEFPADYPAAELAGKTVSFLVRVREVAAPVLPELDEDFLRSVGVTEGGVAELRQELRLNLEREVRQKIRTLVKEQVMEILLQVAPIPVPQVLVYNEIHRMRQNAQEEMQDQAPGRQLPDMPDTLFEASARRRVTLGLIVAELVKRAEISAGAQQVQELIEEMASAYERPEEVVQWYTQNPAQRQQVENLALEEAVVRWVCDQVAVRDVVRSFEDMTRSVQAG
jgi:trigger factor